MSYDHSGLDKTTISLAVLVAIARMAALSVPGVSGIAVVTSSVGRWFRRRQDYGVRMVLQDNMVSGDIHLNVTDNVNIREVGRSVQQQVARAIRETVGLEVTRIDIHVENIDYEATKA